MITLNRKGFKVELGETANTKQIRAEYAKYNTPQYLQCFTPMPRFMLSVRHDTRDTWFWTIGQLYSGYAGFMVNTPYFQITLWIEHTN